MRRTKRCRTTGIAPSVVLSITDVNDIRSERQGLSAISLMLDGIELPDYERIIAAYYLMSI